MAVETADLSPAARALLANPAGLDHEIERLSRQLAALSLHDFVVELWRYVDPAPFRDNWHIRVICEHLEAVTRGEIRRLLINVPPRTSKSIIVSVMWPAWTWTQRRHDDRPLAGPQVKFLTASYAQSLSTRDSVKCRRLIESPLYQRRWGHLYRVHGDASNTVHGFQATGDQNTKMRFENDQGGYRLATSVGGALTGEGGNVLILDDPHNVIEAESELVRQSTLEWFDESLSTRLNDPQTDAMVLIMQRVHHQDLAGHVLEKGGWTHLCLPMCYELEHPHVDERVHRLDPRTADGDLLWPERFPAEVVEQLETDLGSYGSAGQLQQRPAPRSGGMFDPAWWADNIVDALPAGGRAVRGWDLASSVEQGASWTAGVKMRRVGDTYYIEHIGRTRGSPETVEKFIKALAQRDGREVTIDMPQDPGQAGKHQVRYLVRQLAGFNARYSPESGAKEVRAQALSAQTEAGNVKLVRGTWNQKFIDEAALFPNSDYSDQVDAASRAFHRLVRGRGSRGLTAPQLVR